MILGLDMGSSSQPAGKLAQLTKTQRMLGYKTSLKDKSILAWTTGVAVRAARIYRIASKFWSSLHLKVYIVKVYLRSYYGEIRWFLNKLNVELLYDQEILLLDIYPK